MQFAFVTVPLPPRASAYFGVLRRTSHSNAMAASSEPRKRNDTWDATLRYIEFQGVKLGPEWKKKSLKEGLPELYTLLRDEGHPGLAASIPWHNKSKTSEWHRWFTKNVIPAELYYVGKGPRPPPWAPLSTMVPFGSRSSENGAPSEESSTAALAAELLEVENLGRVSGVASQSLGGSAAASSVSALGDDELLDRLDAAVEANPAFRERVAASPALAHGRSCMPVSGTPAEKAIYSRLLELQATAVTTHATCEEGLAVGKAGLAASSEAAATGRDLVARNDQDRAALLAEKRAQLIEKRRLRLEREAREAQAEEARQAREAQAEEARQEREAQAEEEQLAALEEAENELARKKEEEARKQTYEAGVFASLQRQEQSVGALLRETRACVARLELYRGFLSRLLRVGS